MNIIDDQHEDSKNHFEPEYDSQEHDTKSPHQEQ